MNLNWLEMAQTHWQWLVLGLAIGAIFTLAAMLSEAFREVVRDLRDALAAFIPGWLKVVILFGILFCLWFFTK